MANKEQMAFDQKSQKTTIALAIENNPCGICRAMGFPICKGHGGSGGGSDNSETEKDSTYTSNQAASTLDQGAAAIQEFDKAKTLVQLQLSSDRVINYEAGLLSIESDRLHGNLTFRAKPGLSKDEIEIVQQFLKAVETAFNEFKNQLKEQGVPTQNFTASPKDNELTIQIPIPKYYDAFIKHLESKNLLPTPNPEHEEEEKKEDKQAFNPTPFSTRLECK